MSLPASPIQQTQSHLVQTAWPPHLDRNGWDRASSVWQQPKKDSPSLSAPSNTVTRFLCLHGVQAQFLDRCLRFLQSLEGLREIRGGKMRACNNVLILSFFDLRHAAAARNAVQCSEFGEHVVPEFCKPEDLAIAEENQGTIQVRGLPAFVDAAQAEVIFRRFGDVKRIEPCWEVEYFDIRDAAFAVQNLQDLVLFGGLVRVNFKPNTLLHEHMARVQLGTVRGREIEMELAKLQSMVPATPPPTPPSPPTFSAITQRGLHHAPSPPLPGQLHSRASPLSIKQPSTVPPANRIDLLKILRGEEIRTTVMFKHLPNKLTQDQLLDLLNEICPKEFDCVYLRVDFRNKCNCGYCFINFIDPKSVADFTLRVSGLSRSGILCKLIHIDIGKRWKNFNSEKVCEVSFANIQGKRAFVDKFRNSSVMAEPEAYRPKIFYSDGTLVGQEEPFPAPTLTSGPFQHRQSGSSAESVKDLSEDNAPQSRSRESQHLY